MEITGKINQLLEEKYATDELFKDCFTVDIELKRGNILNVFLDADSGIDFDKCRIISRYLEQMLDESLILGEEYTLEVSSPGLSRPLKFLRQYAKNVGRNIDVKLADGTLKKGVLKGVSENGFILEEDGVVLEGKKKKKVKIETHYALSDVISTVVKPTF